MTSFISEAHSSIDIEYILQWEGTPIPSRIRREMERCFQADFRHVRLHTRQISASNAAAVNVAAMTLGNHIVFSEGWFSPMTKWGRWLLAHELTHVMQQAQGRSQSVATLDKEKLEQEANLVANLICAGGVLPKEFGFGAATPGSPQYHQGPPCGGVPIPASDRAIWMAANDAIEMVYREDPKTGAGSALFFGSQFETGRDVLPPSGVPNRQFATMLLKKLRGLVHQRRPDIIDFQMRVFYEIKTANYAQSGMTQIQSYYEIADEVRREYAFTSEPPWKREYATWYPPHEIPFPTDPLGKIVCTQATDHNAYHGGLILYEVRKLSQDERKRRRNNRSVVARDSLEFDSQFSELLPRIQDELKVRLKSFDPESSEYVIIVPEKFFRYWRTVQVNKRIDQFTVKIPPFLDPRYPITRSRFIGYSIICLFEATYVIVAASLIAGTAATAAGGVVASAGSGDASVVSLTAYRALRAAPAAKEVAKAAGVLIVIGSVSTAKGDDAKIGDVSAIRYVPIADFRPVKKFQKATSKTEDGLHACQETTGKFKLGTLVFFDDVPHYIIGRFVVK